MNSWSIEQWAALDTRVSAGRESSTHAARRVLRGFSNSFFLVTRFLPPAKRALVECIYAAVRYPDEVVDTFSLPADRKRFELERWERLYERSLDLADVKTRLREGVPWILAAFTDVVVENSIPREHYRSFLEAMRRDVEPAPYTDLAQLIEQYIYGSAVVVGYFLAHVYGPAPGRRLPEACAEAENLGIALQVTNFCRDVAEDQSRGRLYIPADLIQTHGVNQAVLLMAEHAEERYARAAQTVGVFAADTRTAIRACIDVYRLLNRRILQAGGETSVRHSVPATEKLSVLPAAKYWRIPLAYMGVL